MLASIIRRAAVPELSVECDDGVLEDGDGVVPNVGVERGVEHALLGHLSGEHHLLDLLFVQQMGQRGAVESRMLALVQERVVRPREERAHQFRPTST